MSLNSTTETHTTDVDPSFVSYVDRIMKEEWAAHEVQRIYGKNVRDGKNFAIVITKVIWFAVRLIVERSPTAMRSGHWTFAGAMIRADDLRNTFE